MKLILVCLALLCSASICNAQSKTQFTFGGAIYYPSFITGESKYFADKFPSKSIGVFGISLNTSANIPLSTKSKFVTGIQISFNQGNQHIYGLLWGSDWDDVSNKRHESDTYNRLTIINLEIPLIYSFSKNGKLSYNIGLIPLLSISQKATQIIHYDDNWREDIINGYLTPKLSRSNLALFAGIGIIKKINSTTSVDIIPFVQMNLFTEELPFNYLNNRFFKVGVALTFLKMKPA